MTTIDPAAMTSVAGDPLVWAAILLAGVVSHALRMLPFVVLRPPENAAASPLFRFFDYAAFAVLGGIIGSALLTPARPRADGLCPWRHAGIGGGGGRVLPDRAAAGPAAADRAAGAGQSRIADDAAGDLTRDGGTV
ncbi:AzlD domain-containing protein [Tistrella bauzanensis]